MKDDLKDEIDYSEFEIVTTDNYQDDDDDDTTANQVYSSDDEFTQFSLENEKILAEHSGSSGDDTDFIEDYSYARNNYQVEDSDTDSENSTDSDNSENFDEPKEPSDIIYHDKLFPSETPIMDILRYESLTEVEHRLAGVFYDCNKTEQKLTDLRKNMQTDEKSIADTIQRRLRNCELVLREQSLVSAVENYKSIIECMQNLIDNARDTDNSTIMVNNLEELLEFQSIHEIDDYIENRLQKINKLQLRIDKFEAILRDDSSELSIESRNNYISKLQTASYKLKSAEYLVNRLKLMSKYYESNIEKKPKDDLKRRRIIEKMIAKRSKREISQRAKLAYTRSHLEIYVEGEASQLITEYTNSLKVLKLEIDTLNALACEDADNACPIDKLEATVDTMRYKQILKMAKSKLRRIHADITKGSINGAQGTVRIIGQEQIIEDAKNRLNLIKQDHGRRIHVIKPNINNSNNCNNNEDNAKKNCKTKIVSKKDEDDNEDAKQETISDEEQLFQICNDIRTKLVTFVKEERRCKVTIEELEVSKKRGESTRNRRAVKTAVTQTLAERKTSAEQRLEKITKDLVIILNSLPESLIDTPDEKLNQNIDAYKKRINHITDLIAKNGKNTNSNQAFVKMQQYLGSIEKYQKKIDFCLHNIEIHKINEHYKDVKHLYPVDYTNVIAVNKNRISSKRCIIEDESVIPKKVKKEKSELELKIEEKTGHFSCPEQVNDAIISNRRTVINLLKEINLFSSLESSTDPSSTYTAELYSYIGKLERRNQALEIILTYMFDGDIAKSKRSSDLAFLREQLAKLDSDDAKLIIELRNNVMDQNTYDSMTNTIQQRREDIEQYMATIVSGNKMSSEVVKQKPIREYLFQKQVEGCKLPMEWSVESLENEDFYEIANVNLEFLLSLKTTKDEEYKICLRHLTASRGYLLKLKKSHEKKAKKAEKKRMKKNKQKSLKDAEKPTDVKEENLNSDIPLDNESQSVLVPSEFSSIFSKLAMSWITEENKMEELKSGDETSNEKIVK